MILTERVYLAVHYGYCAVVIESNLARMTSPPINIISPILFLKKRLIYPLTIVMREPLACLKFYSFPL